MTDELTLALDTASAMVSVAVHDGAAVVAERSGERSGKHAEQLAPLIEEVLAEAGATRADLTGIVTGVGPGPFTGLRVGLVTAAVLGYALDLPVRGVCSLDAVALEAVQHGATAPFIAAMDARRREVYWARYEVTKIDGVLVPVREGLPEVSAPAELELNALRAAGRGADLYPDIFGAPLEGPPDPSAGALASLAHLDRGQPHPRFLLDPEPLYLRRPDAQANITRKRVLK
ncbi:tRNA (adenosine(37)-N6)-threonylcarbamoyltransferase complex dimerization subunit type 1 TsaB [Kineosporia sp. NBRC 101731]|uniref:tRNA (adenosine(37)-N6)-threonylcarbamoyltransferase complex dimerization subunit type 1 TsaB n=1 Tax=Kineosporia sp. NBRC 101731 TaxID=3032199 RepID=UPI0024A5596E|nr:tRNA (adenosine(37)-N6)-threonylcarbamoyltransferase complex dimerization subunit type 1 TsaB [Kineosporia sp. NBRC 101731]GLY27736.1 tRNA (adenosine(37)-N6)-threonylcarbamoyltransferase complex dimerization subunit type 1 TsaB [Kineosporia sp. NBRC 101731]